MGQKQFIQFIYDGVVSVVDTAELIGVAQDCPKIKYPGLPEGIAEVILWGGRIYPVLSLSINQTPEEPENFKGAYLITKNNINGPFQEVAIRVQAPIRVILEKSKELKNAKLISVKAYLESLHLEEVQSQAA